MTDEPTLTDEELAEIERRRNDWMYRGFVVNQDMPRLIAALRAARAERERLTDVIDDAATELRYAVDPYKAPEQVSQFVANALRILSTISGAGPSS